MYKDQKIGEFLDDLAGGDPVPGGGSASALAGALACALLAMDANLAAGKDRHPNDDDLLSSLSRMLGTKMVRFLELMDADARAFRRLAEARSLPDDSDEEREQRDAALQDRLKTAAAVPLETATLALEVLDSAVEATGKGGEHAGSDAVSAALLAEAAIRVALLRVFVTMSSLSDRHVVDDLTEVVEEVGARMEGKADRLFSALREGTR
jgi:formiminotetrahydrofolate cyclodeaminase